MCEITVIGYVNYNWKNKNDGFHNFLAFGSVDVDGNRVPVIAPLTSADLGMDAAIDDYPYIGNFYLKNYGDQKALEAARFIQADEGSMPGLCLLTLNPDGLRNKQSYFKGMVLQA